MKKLIIISVFTLFCLNSFSQQSSFKHRFSIQTGSSFLGFTTNIIKASNFESLNDCFATPVGQITYSYFVNPQVSIGAAGSYQFFRFNLTISPNIDAVDVDLHRMNAGLRFLYHYMNTDKINLYSGAKLGLTVWKLYAKSDAIDQLMNLLPVTIPVNPQLSLYSFGFAPQLILFGMDVYFGNHFGINGEICLGPVNSVAGGFNFRF